MACVTDCSFTPKALPVCKFSRLLELLTTNLECSAFFFIFPCPPSIGANFTFQPTPSCSLTSPTLVKKVAHLAPFCQGLWSLHTLLTQTEPGPPNSPQTLWKVRHGSAELLNVNFPFQVWNPETLLDSSHSYLPLCSPHLPWISNACQHTVFCIQHSCTYFLS